MHPCWALAAALDPKAGAQLSTLIALEMPMLDAPREDFQRLARLDLPPLRHWRLAQAQVFQEFPRQHLHRSLHLVSAHKGQESLHVDAPPVQLLFAQRNVLLGPQPV
jgi:hypothetical protein